MKTAKPAAAKKPRPAGSKPPDAERLPVRQLKLVGVAALVFGIVAAVVLSWELMLPVSQEQLVEVAWTHECHCARGWMQTLRQDGFVVRDFETLDLAPTRRHWRVPDSVNGCHPGRFLGYVLDGHVPGEVLRRLAQERPSAVAVMHMSSTDPQDLRFELLQADGSRRAWP